MGSSILLAFPAFFKLLLLPQDRFAQAFAALAASIFI